MVSVIVISLSALGVITLLVALVFWLARWIREALKDLVGSFDIRENLARRARDLDAAVVSRDRVLVAKEAEVVGLTGELVTTRRQRDDAIKLTATLAKDNPTAVSAAMRAQLERLRAISPEVPDVPPVPAPAASEDR